MKSKKALLLGIMAVLILTALTGCNNEVYGTDDTVNRGNGPEQQQTPPAQTDGTTADTMGFNFSQGLDENGYWQNINVLDYVQMFNYQAMQIPADVHQVDEAEVQHIIDDMLMEFASQERIMDRAAANGDTINIDFVGSVDGVEFDGGNTQGQGMDVTLGVTQFIDDFLDQLIGHMPGTVVNVEVTFPDDYWEPSLSGAEALFVTTINYIVGDDIFPELTDELVAEMLSVHGITTVDMMISDIRTFLKENAMHQFIQEYMITQVEVSSIPPALIEYHQQQMLQNYVHQATDWGIELEELLEWFGFEGEQDLFDIMAEDIENGARLSLIMQAVAQDAGITVNRDDVEEFISTNFGEFTWIEEFYGLPWLKQFTRNHKVMEYIMEHAVLL